MKRLSRIGVLSSAILVAGMAHADTLKLIVRAFIPNSVPDNPGYVKTIKDPHGTTITVIESPVPLSGTCFKTDQRSFSTKDSESARLSVYGSFNVLSSPASRVADLSDTGRTEELTCQTGASTCSDKADKSQIRWGTLKEDGATVTFPFEAKAANPCVHPQSLVPDIFLNGEFKLDKITGKLTISGAGSKFPSLEAFAIYDAKSFQLTSLDATGSVLNIPFSRPLTGQATLPIFDGTWTTTDPVSRFTLIISGSSARWIERSASGATLERQVQLRVDKSGLLTAYRDNDATTLAFLGFAPDLINVILSHGVQPSYVTVMRNAGRIDLTWAGVLVIKDAHGRFQAMKQPGEAPVKTFQMTRR